MDNVAWSWAEEVFGQADLGDSRRTRRLVHIAAEAAARPGGRVLEVCRTGASRQGAYDFLSNTSIAPADVQAAVTRAAALECGSEKFCFVVVDGTALTLKDWKRSKDFGSVGSTREGGRGLKVMNAYALSSDGTPVGLLGQQWWKRVARKKRRDCQHRVVEDKETKYWLRAIKGADLLLSTVGTRAWFQIDREGDRFATLKTLYESGHWFTVRSTYGHRYLVGRPRNVRLRHAVAQSKVLGHYTLEVPTKFNRKGRTATMAIRATSVTLDMSEPATDDRLQLPLNVVDVREVGRRPRNAPPIHWRLLTNRAIKTEEEVRAIVRGYTQRWKIEELHRTWKSGACRVEETQLRTADAVMKWAIIMAANASRIERLKWLARNEPDVRATREFTAWEIQAAIVLRRRYKAKNQPNPTPAPSIAEIVLWISEFGGYTGKSSGGPPGAITIRRGLDLIAPVAVALEQLEADGKMR
jgi:hypothetical protein